MLSESVGFVNNAEKLNRLLQKLLYRFIIRKYSVQISAGTQVAFTEVFVAFPGAFAQIPGRYLE
jgi:hypothetical protein